MPEESCAEESDGAVTAHGRRCPDCLHLVMSLKRQRLALVAGRSDVRLLGADGRCVPCTQAARDTRGPYGGVEHAAALTVCERVPKAEVLGVLEALGLA
jgi:hypothetical protein